MWAVLLAVALTVPQDPEAPLFPQAPIGFVSDVAGVVATADVERMTRLITIVQAGSGGEIAIVTLPTIRGRDVNDVALTIGRTWGVGARAAIGNRARNAGVVVLLVPRETSGDGSGYISIQIGQGAEGFIPDAVAGDIRREATPFLARGEYGPGLSLITARLAERFAAEFEFALDSTLVPPKRRQTGIPPFVIIIALFILISLMSGGGRGGRGRRRRTMILPFPMGGGFGGGGFGGGGFGGFGGGGGFSGGGSGGRF